MSDKSHLWYAIKLPLLFLHPDDISLKRLRTRFALHSHHEALSWWFFSPLLWVSDLNRFFSSQNAVVIHWLDNDSFLCLDRNSPLHRCRSVFLFASPAHTDQPRSSFTRTSSLAQNITSPLSLPQAESFLTTSMQKASLLNTMGSSSSVPLSMSSTTSTSMLSLLHSPTSHTWEHPLSLQRHR